MIGWNMKNRCSSIGTRKIRPIIESGGYDHPVCDNIHYPIHQLSTVWVDLT
jgi:hypothetical protein